MEVRQQDSHLQVWRRQCLHATTSHQAISQAREQILLRHLAWKGHIIRRILHWNWRQCHQSKNHQKTSQTMEVQPTTEGCHQWCTMGTKPIKLQSAFHSAKHCVRNKGDRRQVYHSTRGDTSDWGPWKKRQHRRSRRSPPQRRPQHMQERHEHHLHHRWLQQEHQLKVQHQEGRWTIASQTEATRDTIRRAGQAEAWGTIRIT